MGFLLLTMLGVGLAATLLTSSDDRGGGDDSEARDPAEGRDIEVESGQDNPRGGTGDDNFFGIVEGNVRGGAGDDSFSFENGYGASISGGAGDDSFTGGMGDSFTLHGDAGDDLFAFDTGVFDGAVAYGGTGDDRFELEITDSETETGPILSGGSGADSYALTFSEGDAEREGSGKFVTITDFAIGEDSLRVTFPELTNPELAQDPQGNFTDLRLNYMAEGSGGPIDRYMTIRLEGVSGATLEDFDFDTPPDDGGNSGSDGPDLILLREAARLSAGGGDDTIRAADGSESEAMDGLSIDAGDGNDVIDIERLIGGHGVFGGAGDDRIIGLSGTASTFKGGEGDDTIIGGGSHTVFGDGGDDLLQVGSAGAEQGARAEGGDGDDRIVAAVVLGRPGFNLTPSAIGGAGNDVFELEIKGATDPATASPDDRLTYEGLRIEDFNATRDKLVVDLTAMEQSGPTVQSLEVTSTGVTLVFTNGARGFILCNTTGLQEDDIEILTRQGA